MNVAAAAVAGMAAFPSGYPASAESGGRADIRVAAIPEAVDILAEAATLGAEDRAETIPTIPVVTDERNPLRRRC